MLIGVGVRFFTALSVAIPTASLTITRKIHRIVKLRVPVLDADAVS